MQNLLIHVRDHTTRSAAQTFGARLAARLGAGITGIHVTPDPVYAAPAHAPELLAAIMENAQRALADATAAGPAFAAWASAQGVGHADWLLARGATTEALVQAATRHDLLLLDQAAAGDAAATRELAGIILQAGIPCLVMPRNGLYCEQLERVCVAWNASPEAMRALHAALPFLPGKQVTLLVGEERERSGAVEWLPPFDVVRWLEGRGVLVERRAIHAKSDAAGYALLDEALKSRAQLLVMGAWGRSRISEWILGGATHHALTLANIPVLYRH